MAAEAERKLRRRERKARKRRHEAVAQGLEGPGKGLGVNSGCGGSSRAEGGDRALSMSAGVFDTGADLSALVHAYVDGCAACGHKSAKRARCLPSASTGAGPWVAGARDREDAPVHGRAVKAGTGSELALGTDPGGYAGGQENADGPNLKALRVQAMRAVLAQLQQ